MQQNNKDNSEYHEAFRKSTNTTKINQLQICLTIHYNLNDDVSYNWTMFNKNLRKYGGG